MYGGHTHKERVRKHARDEITENLILRKVFVLVCLYKIKQIVITTYLYAYILCTEFNRLLTRSLLVRMNFVIICSEMMRIF